MAGRETAGFGSATADLFVDRPWVITPGAHARPGDPELVEVLARVCGARTIRLSAEDHDRATAAISHLPLLLSVALVEAVAGYAGGPDHEDWPTARSLAASGWRDMTRLARGDVEMAVGIMTTNAPAVAARIRDLRAILDEWLVELEAEPAPDPGRLARRFRAARDRLAQGFDRS
jgi:prephenate dehydrogenase